MIMMMMRFTLHPMGHLVISSRLTLYIHKSSTTSLESSVSFMEGGGSVGGRAMADEEKAAPGHSVVSATTYLELCCIYSSPRHSFIIIIILILIIIIKAELHTLSTHGQKTEGIVPDRGTRQDKGSGRRGALHFLKPARSRNFCPRSSRKGYSRMLSRSTSSSCCWRHSIYRWRCINSWCRGYNL